MKTFLPLALSSLLLSVSSVASEVTTPESDEILHAVFAAFQEPGVLSEEHISASQALLVSAAESGNFMARLVVDRGNIQAVTSANAQPEEARIASN